MSKFLLNQVVKGSKGSYRLIKSLTPHVFQAKVEGTTDLAAIKIPPANPYLFNDEKNTYSWQTIKTCPHIRSLREFIDDESSQCLVFEWMDRTLWDAKDESTEQKMKAFKAVARSCLQGLLAFQKMDRVNDYCHADLNPNNILISGFPGANPIVKISDLGFTTRAGSVDKHQARLQGDAIRAPEIWKGAAPTPAMDVWSLGVSLADWITAKAVFGYGGCNIETNFGPDVTKNAWAIAKLHKVRGAPLCDPLKEEYSSDFIVAEAFLQDNLVKDLSLREQLGQQQIPSDCISFIEDLLTIDPEERPSVDDALAHPYLQI
ncbi:kinase-like protein [Microthyrium microscopicum]|uniref:Kinase-like protein n=1 Tax=Microthyrium microscopicum TaxID=703497 RepID=A0A6A6TYR5_9PEZI|nr:kinase-like protein [Microthyrium microscopicum]